MKNYRTSDKPSLAQVGQFIYTRGTPVRKPKVTTKMLLKERAKARTVLVKDSRETKYKYGNVITRVLDSMKGQKMSDELVEFLHQLIDAQDKPKN